MKKFLISLLIVLVFSVVVFIIGLVPLRIKADSYGIVVSKTSGINEKPILNGDKTWCWELLLPTNAIVKEFSPKPLNITKTISGELPSGTLYSSMFNATDNFQYSFSFNMSLTVTPENVVELLKQNKISNNDDLREYLSVAADSVAQLATNFYLDKAYNDPSFRPEAVRREQITKQLSLQEDFPEVDLTVFALTNVKYPDYNLYKQFQNQFNFERMADVVSETQESSSSKTADKKDTPAVAEEL